MLKFDESRLVTRLQQLGAEDRVAFAAACAERLMPSYEKFAARSKKGHPITFGRLLGRLWEELDSPIPKDIEEVIEESERIAQGEEEGEWTLEQAAAEDATAALAYALRCRKSGQPQEAAWAARRAYEALDRYVINQENLDTNAAGTEQYIAKHPLIQAELERQRRDLEDLLDRKISRAELRARAKGEAPDFLP